MSSWAVAVGGYLGDGGFNTFAAFIPHNFYTLLTIFTVFVICATGVDFGPMKQAELDNAARVAKEERKPIPEEGNHARRLARGSRGECSRRGF